MIDLSRPETQPPPQSSEEVNTEVLSYVYLAKLLNESVLVSTCSVKVRYGDKLTLVGVVSSDKSINLSAKVEEYNEYSNGSLMII